MFFFDHLFFVFFFFFCKHVLFEDDSSDSIYAFAWIAFVFSGHYIIHNAPCVCLIKFLYSNEYLKIRQECIVFFTIVFIFILQVTGDQIGGSFFLVRKFSNLLNIWTVTNNKKSQKPTQIEDFPFLKLSISPFFFLLLSPLFICLFFCYVNIFFLSTTSPLSFSFFFFKKNSS